MLYRGLSRTIHRTVHPKVPSIKLPGSWLLNWDHTESVPTTSTQLWSWQKWVPKHGPTRPNPIQFWTGSRWVDSQVNTFLFPSFDIFLNRKNRDHYIAPHTAGVPYNRAVAWPEVVEGRNSWFRLYGIVSPDCGSNPESETARLRGSNRIR